MAIRKVALVGTRGRLGPWLLKALIESEQFEVTVLQRTDSTAEVPTKYKENVQVKALPPNYADDVGKLAEQLSGQEAVVVSIPASKTREHKAIMNACIRTGVRRMIPADYGSVDSSDDFCANMIPAVYGNKRRTREMLQQASSDHPAFTWTSLVCGHFFDYGLESDLLAFNLSTDPPSALIFDDGNTRWSASTRDQIGRAVVSILTKEEETANRMLYMQSFCTSQNEVLQLLQKTSEKSFRITKVASEDYMEQKKKEMDDGIQHDSMEELVAVLGLKRADWRSHPDFSNELLGLETESVQTQVEKVWSAKEE